MTALDHLPYAEGVAVQRMRDRIAVARKAAKDSYFTSEQESAELDVRLLSIAVQLLEVPFSE